MARKSRKETSYRTSDVIPQDSVSEKYKAALYVRLSRESEKTIARDTIGIQRALLEEFAAIIPDVEVADVYVDDDITGTNFHRPDYERMMQDVNTGKINCIIVKDLSRFARDHIDAGEYLDKIFPEKRIRFIAITDKVDTLQNDGGIIVPFKNVLNERYAKDSAVKIKNHFRKMQEKGEFCGWKPSYGYKRSMDDKHLLEIDEDAAGVVRKIFDWYDNGVTIHKICNLLEKDKILCPKEYALDKGQFHGFKDTDKKFRWHTEVVGRILANEQYCGHMIQHKYESMFLSTGIKGEYKTHKKEDWIIVENTHSPIISAEQFERVQERLLDNIKKHKEKLQKNKHIKNPEYCLRSVVKCGHCGKSICVKRVVKNGTARYFYVCPQHDLFGNARCEKKSLDFEETNKAIFLIIKRYIDVFFDMEKALNDISASSSLKLKIESLKLQRKQVETELRKTKILKSKLYEDYCIGLLDETDYTDMSLHYSKKIESFESEIKEINKTIDVYTVDTSLDSELKERLLKFRKSRKLTKSMVDAFINSITIDNYGKLDIDMKIKDEYDMWLRKVTILEGELENAV